MALFDHAGISLEKGDSIAVPRDQVGPTILICKVEDMSILGDRPMIELTYRIVIPAAPNGRIPFCFKTAYQEKELEKVKSVIATA